MGNDETLRPLHVLVAEALGWEELELVGTVTYNTGGQVWDQRHWKGRPRTYGLLPSTRSHREDVPAFDTDWRATGPLVERYGIGVGPVRYFGGEKDGQHTGEWYACAGWYDERENHRGATPLFAICNLILALAREGKLSLDTPPSKA
jgi:hypothetical protein